MSQGGGRSFFCAFIVCMVFLADKCPPADVSLRGTQVLLLLFSSQPSVFKLTLAKHKRIKTGKSAEKWIAKIWLD